MNYFVTNDERIGTCYHEFFKGKWDGKTFWKEDSLCLDDDLLCEYRAFGNAILSVIPSYNPFGITEISPEQWEAIGKQIAAEGDNIGLEMYREADAWVQDVFSTYDCFTILGI
ncbi:MAG: hypothetical protein IJ334_14365 [Clostridia bacterium]|nr:hypothetical protein [Clostridia bacterium]